MKNRVFILSDLKRVIKKKQGYIIGGEYENSKSKFKFKCKEGHIWETTPSIILKGHWCKKCSTKNINNKQRGSIEPVLKYIEERNGKFISGNYINQHSRITLECEIGHQWDVTINNLLSKKSWCRECLGTKKKSIEEYKLIGTNRGGKCLSNEYINHSTKLEWECSEGHKFLSSPNNVKSGKWCPECSQGIYERVCRFYFEKIFNKPFVKVRPDWLKNPKSKLNLEIDGFNDELKLGFEHQGKQHYKDISYFKNNLTINNDKIKRSLFKKNGVKIIEIPQLVSYIKINNLKDFIYTELKKLKINPSVPYDSLNISEYELYTYTKNKERKNLERMVNSILNENHFNLIHMKYDGGYKVDLECKNYHQFSTSISKVLSHELKCPHCEYKNNIFKYRKPEIRNGKIIYRLNNKNTHLLLDKFNTKLNSEGGKIINGEMINGNSILEIQCVNFHIVKSSINEYNRRGCKECNRMRNIKISTLIKKINEKGGQVISQTYNTGKYYFKIKCKNNHLFDTDNLIIRNNKWCPECKSLSKKIKKNESIDKLNKRLDKINGICLDYIPNSKNKLKFKCSNNHIFYSTLNNVIYGFWCKDCSVKKLREKTYQNRKDKIYNFVENKGGKILLEPKTFDEEEIIKVECKEGHIWESKVEYLMSNSWCRKCGLHERWRKSKITITEINDIIRDRGGKCLSKEYKNSNQDKLHFQCSKGHQWESIWSNIKKGSWCPKCSKKGRVSSEKTIK